MDGSYLLPRLWRGVLDATPDEHEIAIKRWITISRLVYLYEREVPEMIDLGGEA